MTCEDTGTDEVCSSYYLLLFARALSGVGEASIAAIAGDPRAVWEWYLVRV